MEWTTGSSKTGIGVIGIINNYYYDDNEEMMMIMLLAYYSTLCHAVH